jgi:hypothetical protein
MPVLQLARRIQRLEAQLTDATGLRPQSREWRAHWEEQLSKIVSGGEAGEPHTIPLEIWDAIED